MEKKRLLELTRQEYEVLISVQVYLTHSNIESTEEKSLKAKKLKWFNKWKEILISDETDLVSPTCFEGLNLTKLSAKLATLTDFKKRIILFEAVLYEPFFDLKIRSLSGLRRETEDEIKSDSPMRKEKLYKIYTLGSEVGVKKKELESALSIFEDSIKKITPSRVFQRLAVVIAAATALAVTAGVAAPAIGTMIGGYLGLSGAAATSAGLALLGGGALSVGGFGMLGGTIVIIGGGGILGAVAGDAMQNILIDHPKLLIRESAKLLTILKSFCSHLENRESQEFIDFIIDGIRSQNRKIMHDLEVLNKKSKLSKRMTDKKSALDEALKIYTNLLNECLKL